jgi:hypothetical protein
MALPCQISDTAEELNMQLVEQIGNKPFTMQIDEVTESANDAHLITYV